MAQHDYVISNDDGASIRADWNVALAAIKSGNSHASAAPSSPVQGMRWCKTVDATHQEVYEYDGTVWVLICTINPTTHVIAKPTFFAHKNGTDQTGLVSGASTKVTFGTEEFDIGGYFASSTYTPLVAGKYLLTAAVRWTSANAVDNEQLEISIYKNGVIHRSHFCSRPGTSFQQTSLTAIVDANGTTDFFEVYATKNGAGNGDVQGLATATYFQGAAI